MLVQLLIQDIVLINQLDIEFNSNLSVLTGETGAGKSILLDALSLALGARGDGGLVRAGQTQGQVRAVFSLNVDHRVLEFLQANEILSQDQISDDGGYCEVILRRVQTSDGRTRAYINDVPVSVSQLREIGQMLVEIHGQHDDRALMDGDMHRVFLDAFGGLETQLQLVSAAWKDLAATRKEMHVLQARVEEAAREAEYLRSSVMELEILAPEIGEEAKLAEQRQLMMEAQNIAGDLSEAEEILTGKSSAAPVLASLARRLERKSEKVPGLLEDVLREIDSALTHLYAAQNEIGAAINKGEYDPQSLDNAEERLFALRAAARKYSVAVENLPELATKLADQLSDLDHGEERLGHLKKQCDVLEKEYDRLAGDLSKKRGIAGKTLAQLVCEELPSLKLDAAEFLVEQQSDEALSGPFGHDRIEFWVRTNPGTNAGPMFKVASGGELSRFLLALKVVLADKGSAPTLVFDEIDTGVGGAVADAIGRRLARLAQNVQVLSVTHAPQVAAQAQHHLLISKAANGAQDKQLATSVVPIIADNRRDEIARMLAGATITNEARAAAEQLLDVSVN